MSQKKKKQPVQQHLSPGNYVRTKARNLPLAECLITPDWQNCGEVNIIVARRHTSGSYTLGVYLVDTYCLGLKDTFFRFNLPEGEYEELKDENFTTTAYEEVHNIIYGAIAYAQDLGINPHHDFSLTQYILEEDTDDVPLIEYEFGMDGKPFLIANSRSEANRYRSIIKKATGENIEYSLPDEAEDEEYDEDFPAFTKEKMLDAIDRFSEKMKKSRLLPHTEYAYKYPEYPKTLTLAHEELHCLFSPANNAALDDETIDRILSLPRESLINDLENCIFYEIGRTCGEISEEKWDEEPYAVIIHALLLLCELKAEESLPAILEIIRQNEDFYDYHIGDIEYKHIRTALYATGRHQLSALLSYAKESGLYTFLKLSIFQAVAMIAVHEPERRTEVMDWFREILNFYYEKRVDSAYFDADLVGMLQHDLMNIHAKELLPDIKRLYDTGLVDEMCCGCYSDVEKEIMSATRSAFMNEYDLLPVREKYRKRKKLFD
jgi:hypothetical protein